MDQETIRKQLAKDLPDYEIAAETAALEDAAPDEPVQVEANAGSLKAWRKVSAAGPGKKTLRPTSDLKNRFRKRAL